MKLQNPAAEFQIRGIITKIQLLNNFILTQEKQQQLEPELMKALYLMLTSAN